ncbi:hypothetical protein LHYA1_G009164 [Lachnellula hyalina]|uniref:Uncharacterized protein n=1 Tax=Lachnellula hyalina TaxID=1316788 RepID=A0A8H8TVB5_9HELO|nr:uncharacterized protein LHYA1_G009164 [Lachnellula hyalina]TVY22075.1 hypothetical protein LHYA1_G009164 [Lachnellula hyalina]
MPEEASAAVRNRLYIAGISIRCEKHYTTRPTAQYTSTTAAKRLSASYAGKNIRRNSMHALYAMLRVDASTKILQVNLNSAAYNTESAL